MKIIFGLVGLLCGQLSFATLVPLGAVSLSSQGLGAVNTVLTFTSPAATTFESVCVGAGVLGVLVTGAGACPAGYTSGNEQAINTNYSAAGLGLKNFQICKSSLILSNRRTMRPSRLQLTTLP